MKMNTVDDVLSVQVRKHYDLMSAVPQLYHLGYYHEVQFRTVYNLQYRITHDKVEICPH